MEGTVKSEFVTSRKEANISVICFNRPEARNAVNRQLTRQFRLALREAEADPEVKVIVPRAQGMAFCAGHDFKEDTAGGAGETIGEILLSQVVELPPELSVTSLLPISAEFLFKVWLES
jgi:enoyl-CoA hydratase/carnithine racemase